MHYTTHADDITRVCDGNPAPVHESSRPSVLFHVEYDFIFQCHFRFR